MLLRMFYCTNCTGYVNLVKHVSYINYMMTTVVMA